MRSLTPEQLLLLAIFLLVPLLNLTARWLRRRLARHAPPSREAEAVAEQAGAPPPPRSRRGTAGPGPPPEQPRRRPPPAPPAPGPRRRPGALGGPRGLRRAIVMMTILGPCRALEPPVPGDGRPTTPPAG
jgi:hypothetical protein